jgi:hypothetical protein
MMPAIKIPALARIILNFCSNRGQAKFCTDKVELQQLMLLDIEMVEMDQI